MQSVKLHTPDAHTLAGIWYPSKDPVGTVLLAGAFAVPQRYYDRLANSLAERGLNVLTLDYRGIGASRVGGLVGFRATLRDWGENDLAAGLDAAEVLGGGRPLAYLAHSFGGQALGLAPTQGRIVGALTVCSQFGALQNYPQAKRWQYLAQLRLGTALARQFGYLPAWAGIGEDVPAGVFAQWAQWCQTPNYLVDHVPGAAEVFAEVRVPVQLWFADDDPMAPEAAVRALAARLPNATVRGISAAPFGGLGHFGIMRRETALWSEMAEVLRGFTLGTAAVRTA